MAKTYRPSNAVLVAYAVMFCALVAATLLATQTGLSGALNYIWLAPITGPSIVAPAPQDVCGDGYCSGDEMSDTCSQDCPSLPAVAPLKGGSVVTTPPPTVIVPTGVSPVILPTATPGTTISPVTTSPMTQCKDDDDNDGDGLTDTDDPDCKSADDDSEQPLTHCNDNDDNDGDGRTDMDDPGCTAPMDNDERKPCNNGIDDNNDGLTDSQQPACHSDQDKDNPNSYDPGLLSEELHGGPGVAICDDGDDNDGDGLTDMDDPDCKTPQDMSEVTQTECNDGDDNDGDGLTDGDSPACHTDEDSTDPSTYDGTLETETQFSLCWYDEEWNLGLSECA